uniref:Kinetochore protein Spc24 n=1 Tax=Paramormyrops kingsleyae TaxID=1676925 RepID=A0A3B3S2M8_9TELE
MVSLDKGLQHLEETGEDLVSIVESSNAESIARAVVEKRQQLFDLLITTRKTTSQLLNDMIRTEELVGQNLLDTEVRKSEAARELESLQQELERCRARKHTMEAELQFLQGELKSLQNSEVEIETLQQEVDEDTTEVIPSAMYEDAVIMPLPPSRAFCVCVCVCVFGGGAVFTTLWETTLLFFSLWGLLRSPQYKPQF